MVNAGGGAGAGISGQSGMVSSGADSVAEIANNSSDGVLSGGAAAWPQRLNSHE
jgi:hypothetical protein